MALDENPYQAPLTAGEPRARPRRAQSGTPHIGWAVLGTIVGTIVGGASIPSPPTPTGGNHRGPFIGGIVALMAYFAVRGACFIRSKLESSRALKPSETGSQE